MSTLGPSVPIEDLRQRLAARLVALPWLAAWGGGAMWEAPVPFDGFGISQVPDAVPATKAHGAFAIGIRGTPKFEGRQVAGHNVVANTNVRVRFFARHTPGPTKSKTSEDAAAAIEQAVRSHLMDRTGAWPGQPAFQLILDSVEPRACPPPGNWFVHEIAFTARHPVRL